MQANGKENKKMKYVTEPTVEVKAHLLIEDIQHLNRAVETQNWQVVKDTVECLSELMETGDWRNTESIGFKPGPSSIMVPEKGILCNDNGSDVTCANGMGVSSLTSCGVSQCPESCPKHGKCMPEKGRMTLKDGFPYIAILTDEKELMGHLVTTKGR